MLNQLLELESRPHAGFPALPDEPLRNGVGPWRVPIGDGNRPGN